MIYRAGAAIFLTILQAQAAQAQHVTTLVTGITASGDVSLGHDGRLYVADFGIALGADNPNKVNVYSISPRGKVKIFSTGFGGASGNDFGRDGYLYQSDIGRGEVYRIAPNGHRTRIASGLKDPVGVVLGPGKVVYVTQCAANIISRITPSGNVQTLASGKPLNCPNGLTVGPDGNLYTTNFFDGAMIKIELPSGRMTLHANIPGGGNGHVGTANGRFYVASFRGRRIFEVTMAGDVCPIAGSGEAGNADGDGAAATFFRPNGIALSADGDTLYTNTMTKIVEKSDLSLHPNAVRKITGLRSLPPCTTGKIATH